MLLNVPFVSKTAPRGGEKMRSDGWEVMSCDCFFAPRGGFLPNRAVEAPQNATRVPKFACFASIILIFRFPHTHIFRTAQWRTFCTKKRATATKQLPLLLFFFAPRGGKISLVVAIVACCTATCTVRGSDLAFWAIRRGCPFPPLRPCGLPQFCRRVER